MVFVSRLDVGMCTGADAASCVVPFWCIWGFPASTRFVGSNLLLTGDTRNLDNYYL